MRFHPGMPISATTFNLFRILGTNVPGESLLRVTPLLYEVRADGKTAELVEFDTLELKLPPLAPIPAARPPLPGSSPLPVDPAWANEDRAAALAELPVPSARWIPWAAWAAAATAILAAGLLLHRRRRASRLGKSTAP